MRYPAGVTCSCCSHAESERAKEKEGRLGFLKFHRRNSAASARSVSLAPSIDISESDAGTEPPPSHCGTPVPAETDLEQGQPESVSISRQLCAHAATIIARGERASGKH